jgi:hypothetical protein
MKCPSEASEAEHALELRDPWSRELDIRARELANARLASVEELTPCQMSNTAFTICWTPTAILRAEREATAS